MRFSFFIVAVCGFFFILFGGANAFAANASLKIGIMNVQKVLVDSEAGQKAKAVFEAKKNELEAAFKADQENLAKMQEEIEKKGSVWSKEKKEEQILAFNKMRRDLQTESEDARMEMQRLQDKELEPIIKKLETVVDEFGAKNGYSMILDSKTSVIFYDQAYDISDELIKELNKAMK